MIYVQHSQEAPNESVNKDGIPTIVLNKLLCFVHNKINLLLSETITQLCSKHYRSEEIEVAKEIIRGLSY